MAEASTEQDPVGRHIVDATFAVHGTLGPGLLEAACERCLACELNAGELPFQWQVAVSVRYRDKQIDARYRMDLSVGGLVVADIKVTENILPADQDRLVTDLKLSGCRLGLLINGNVVSIKCGHRQWVNSG